MLDSDPASDYIARLSGRSLAKPKKIPSRPEGASAAATVEQPAFRWKVIAQILGAFAILWVVAFMTTPYIGYWGVGVVALLTALALGFGIYAFTLTRKTQAIASILQGATDAEGRKAALEKLEAGDSKDALNGLARAQILAQENPAEAIATLEKIDLAKAPGPTQDEVRSMLALLYLVQNRPRDARPVAELIRLDRQPSPKAKAMCAAVMAESFARTGKSDEAKRLLETYSGDDAAYGEMRPMLLRAQVYTFMSTKNRGLARKSMDKLVAIDPNHIAPFVDRSASPDLQKMAMESLSAAGYQARPKTQMKMMR